MQPCFRTRRGDTSEGTVRSVLRDARLSGRRRPRNGEYDLSLQKKTEPHRGGGYHRWRLRGALLRPGDWGHRQHADEDDILGKEESLFFKEDGIFHDDEEEEN